MSKHAQFWTRLAVVGLAAIILSSVLDLLLGVKWGSGRDWLIYFTLLLVGDWFFVFRWARKTGFFLR